MVKNLSRGGILMQYKDFQGLSLSRLGMGNMRLPASAPRGPIDTDKAEELIDYVYHQGINYFDTAYFYHEGQSESFLGHALSRYPRDSYFLADKMPASPLKSEGKTPAEIFEGQLAKCRTDHFDFYLLHNVCEDSIPVFTDETLGVIPYLLEQKKAGRIRHLGLSSHSRPDTLRAFLSRYDFFEFIQIQLNYLDWDYQNAKEQYDIITQYGVPVWVMEPCRGGRLASLCPEGDALLRAVRPDLSIASWAFRWVLSLPNVGMVLSGMSDLEQARDNIATFSACEPFSPTEGDALDRALELLKTQLFVPCTQCHYCDGCPQGLDIPQLLGLYNNYRLSGGRMAYDQLSQASRPDRCISCGQCAAKCPQHIDIPAVMARYAQAMAG